MENKKLLYIIGGAALIGAAGYYLYKTTRKSDNPKKLKEVKK